MVDIVAEVMRARLEELKKHSDNPEISLEMKGLMLRGILVEGLECLARAQDLEESGGRDERINDYK